MAVLNKVSSLVSSQLPQFIREDHPLFVEFLEKYYEFLELPGNPIYETKRFDENFDVNLTRESLLKYFKNKIIPSFPDSTMLSAEKIIKASRDFYAKKGTADSFKFLFRVLYGQEVEVFFPKLEILKASDGKWNLPQALRLTISSVNENIDVNLLEKRKAYGSISRASCKIEAANKTVDAFTGREIFEFYVTDINRLFLNGEFLEISYTDSNGNSQLFSEKIVGAISNIRINPRRRGRKYYTGDPVVINGGQDPNATNPSKAVAVVGNVTAGSIDSVTVLKGGYGFRLHPNSLIDVVSANGVGANLTISLVDTDNVEFFNYCTDSIIYKANETLDASDYGFDNIALANINTTINDAFSYEQMNLYPIKFVTVVNGGSFFDEEPIVNPISLYDSDYSLDENSLILISPGEFNTYNPGNASIKLVGSEYSTVNNWYVGWRILVEKHFREIIAYDGATKTVFLNRKFENNITPINILTKNLYLDARPNIQTMGRIANVEILNGGTGYNVSDTLQFIGTGYDAAGTITVSGSGEITDVTLSNRGEGYPVAPIVNIITSTGSGAVLKAVLYADGEELDVVTSDIGQIRDFKIINRGTDYVSTPNVSLKIYDLLVSPPGLTETIIENDIVFQGQNVNAATFRATVDAFYPSNNVIRVFNYSGIPSVGQNLTVVKATTNVNVVVQTANIDGKIYPYRYGDGKARANVEFLNGLIRFNGYYLNTDGHLSADRYLQDANKYQNFSYSLVSEVPYKDYAKTILDVSHPAGAKLIPVFDMKSDYLVVDNSNSNVHITTTILTSNVINISVDRNSVVVVGSEEEEFDLYANVNDIIVINSENVVRSVTKIISQISNNRTLNIESPCIVIGEGRARTNALNAVIRISGNTNPLPAYIDTTDEIRINVGGNILFKTINSISGNAITLNSNAGIGTTNSNLVYELYPKFENVYYKIIRTDF